MLAAVTELVDTAFEKPISMLENTDPTSFGAGEGSTTVTASLSTPADATAEVATNDNAA